MRLVLTSIHSCVRRQGTQSTVAHSSVRRKLEACPIVIMAAPFGWQKDLRMPEYAITFAEVRVRKRTPIQLP